MLVAFKVQVSVATDSLLPQECTHFHYCRAVCLCCLGSLLLCSIYKLISLQTKCNCSRCWMLLRREAEFGVQAGRWNSRRGRLCWTPVRSAGLHLRHLHPAGLLTFAPWCLASALCGCTVHAQGSGLCWPWVTLQAARVYYTARMIVIGLPAQRWCPVSLSQHIPQERVLLVGASGRVPALPGAE